MEDRDMDYTLMNIQRYGGGMTSLLMTSTAMSMKLMVFLLRMAKKGLMSLKFSKDYERFLGKTGGNFAVYNIPLSKEHAERLQENLDKIADLEDTLAETKNPRRKTEIRKEIEKIKADMPEYEQLEKLGIDFCALPKVNGLDHTMQVAVANKDTPLFKNWFINHISGELSGGAKDFDALKAMTEGNSSIFNVPVEGEQLSDMLHDLDILEVNYAVLPDLKAGDGCTQIAVANADMNTLKAWFSMYQQKQLAEGNDIGPMYPISEGSYIETGAIDAQEYVSGADEKYKEANAEYESQGQDVVQNPAIKDENCNEYMALVQNDNYTKITIDWKTLIHNASQGALSEIDEMGYFGARIPGTFGKMEKDLMLPKDHVFSFRDGYTYVGFIPKNGQTKVYDTAAGRVEDWSHQEIMKKFDKVDRSLRYVKNIMGGPQKGQAPVIQSPGQQTVEPSGSATGKLPVTGERQPESRNRFKNFTEREYDMPALERLLMQRQFSNAQGSAQGSNRQSQTPEPKPKIPVPVPKPGPGTPKL